MDRGHGSAVRTKDMAMKGAKKLYPEDEFVGERIRVLRIAKDLSQTKLAESSGITFQQVQKYEKGINRVSIGRLMRFAEILNVPVTELLPPQALMKAAGKMVGKADVDPCHELSLTSRGQRLARAFNGIGNEEVRHQIMALAESINEAQTKKPPRKAGA